MLRFNVNCSSNSWPHIIAEMEHYRPSSATFCIRDHDGNLIVAKGFKLPDMTNMVAEAIAIRESLIYCSEHGIEHVILETDSLTMVHILVG
uniref:Putative ovule protein n=1 Tax=Solanum chacoense TaxID=4108 RepID=A0A0V0GRZ9_SOLCH